MKNKKPEEKVPVELNEALLETVAAGESIPTADPSILYAHSSGMSSSILVPTRDEEGNLIYVAPTPVE